MLAIAIEQFHQEHGRYPEPATLHQELVEAEIWPTDEISTVFVDHWDHEIIYRVPGKHGAFDLHSVGVDGIDTEGAQDDISNWAGVNDGYHWKEHWPYGRFAVATGVALALGLLVAGRRFHWPVALPISGIALCSGVALGSILLRHPGVVPDRNIPLGIAVVAAVLGMVAFTLRLCFALRRNKRISIQA